MKDKTRILVTHHLDVARYADIILVMEQGRIAQQGSFQELASSPGIFQTLLEDYGNTNPTEKPLDTAMTPNVFVPTATNAEIVGARNTAKLLLGEDRATGKVPGLTYLTLFKAMGLSGLLTVAVISSALGQCSQIGSNLFLGFWSGGTILGFRTEQYMGIYAGLGGAFAVLTFVASYSMGLAGLRAAFLMLQKSLRSVLRAPTSFHDRTPTGRITSRLTKDVEVIDDQLATALNDVLTLVYRLCGSFALVLYAYPYLGGLLFPMAFLYYAIASFYRRTSRQVKRIESTTRSAILARFSEQVVGVASIRVFGQQQYFIAAFSEALDYHNRFYYATVMIRRWLAVRLQAFASVLILAVSIFGVCLSRNVSPAVFSVALVYTIQTSSSFGHLINLYTSLEQSEFKALPEICGHFCSLLALCL
jgi:ABC-type multidrug transport system fused ATPase/permease subunit